MINYSSNGTTPVMSDLNSASVKNGNKATFWKKNAKNVPGRWVSTSYHSTTIFRCYYFHMPRNYFSVFL